MLTITVPKTELFDRKKEEFIYVKEQKLSLEHSLISLARWESKWKKSFLSPEDKTRMETLDYIRCMTLTQNVAPEVYYAIPDSVINEVNNYIADSMTATTFRKDEDRPTKEIITAELIYYWMISLNIPLECQKWHLNRLLTLIKVCSIKNAPQKKKKMTRSDIANRSALNEVRRKSLNSKG